MYCAVLKSENKSFGSIIEKHIAFTSALDLFVNATKNADSRIIVSDESTKSTENVSFVSKSDFDISKLSCDTVMYMSEIRPIISSKTIEEAYEYHKSNNFDITILAATDCNLDNSTICNGIYFCKKEIFDINGVLMQDKKIGTFKLNEDELFVVNNPVTLLKANEIMQSLVNAKLMENGIFLTSSSVYIAPDAIIGEGTTILPNTVIKPGTKIGSNCVIGPNTQITNSTVGNGTSINSSVLLDCEVGEETTVGPFAYIRPNSKISNHVKIGDFVEIKNSTIDEGTKVSHLTYVGDCDVGKKVNFGCGTVLVNYDGKNKYRSKIGNNAFIGCNANLVSPVTVEDNAFIAAGSTITDDVPNDTLAIARARQVIKDNWKRKK